MPPCPQRLPHCLPEPSSEVWGPGPLDPPVSISCNNSELLPLSPTLRGGSCHLTMPESSLFTFSITQLTTFYLVNHPAYQIPSVQLPGVVSGSWMMPLIHPPKLSSPQFQPLVSGFTSQSRTFLKCEVDKTVRECPLAQSGFLGSAQESCFLEASCTLQAGKGTLNHHITSFALSFILQAFVEYYYVLSCVPYPHKFICWSLKPLLWLYLEMGSLWK